MKELEYPFDAESILAKKKKLRRQLLESGGPFIDKRIAILGGSTTSDIKLMLELFLLNQGIRPSFYESEYNQYYQDAMFPNAALEAFAPDIIYIHTTDRNVTAYSRMTDDAAAVDAMLDVEMEKFEDARDCVKTITRFEHPLALKRRYERFDFYRWFREIYGL